jgi:hypothetical protein
MLAPAVGSIAAAIVASFLALPPAPPAATHLVSVVGPCTSVLAGVSRLGEAAWVRQCEQSSGGTGSMTYAGVTRTCRAWVAECRKDAGFPRGGKVRTF